MNLICRYIAGSQSYGLDTPASDTDYRGVFLNDNVGDILNPYQYDASSVKTHVSQERNVDESYHELRKFLNILRCCNTNAVEMMFNDKWELTTPLWQKIQSQRINLMNPDKFYTSLCGYMTSELRLATGERTGKLGGKRFAVVEKLGFSPKNFVQLLRLCCAGTIFFELGTFPVNLEQYPSTRKMLMEIKCYPEHFIKKQLVEWVNQRRLRLDRAYTANKSQINTQYKWDESIATQLMLEAYFPILKAKMPGRHWFSSWFSLDNPPEGY